MFTLAAEHATLDVRRAVALVLERLGPHRAVVGRGWDAFARACDLEAPTQDSWGSDGLSSGATPVIVGDVGHLMATVAALGGLERAGFVVPGAWYPASWWRRLRIDARHVDPTQQLWGAGWTPLSVHRIEVRRGRTIVEVVIGDARVRPASLVGRSAFDNPD